MILAELNDYLLYSENQFELQLRGIRTDVWCHVEGEA